LSKVPDGAFSVAWLAAKEFEPERQLAESTGAQSKVTMIAQIAKQPARLVVGFNTGFRTTPENTLKIRVQVRELIYPVHSSNRFIHQP
jgi:hypothetical protein